MSMLDSSHRNQNKSAKVLVLVIAILGGLRSGAQMRTLFACFVLSFSNIFCDWVFEARAAMFAIMESVPWCLQEGQSRARLYGRVP